MIWLELDLMEPTLTMLRNRLKEFREARGLSQIQLGELAGYSDATTSRMESGEVKLNSHNLLALATALGCHPLELISDEYVETTASQRELLALVSDLSPEALAALVASAKAMKPRTS